MKPSDILAEICAYKIEVIKKAASHKSLKKLQKEVKKYSNCSNFYNELNRKISNKNTALIAEIKKASPTRGIIRDDFDPKKLAIAYKDGGATCLSVLTDEKYFQGHNDNILIAKKASNLPILRKDFILAPYQVYESKIIGADCILLIMACLNIKDAIELEKIAIDLGLDVLVEIHNEQELELALKLQTKLLGINNRNLKNLTVDLNISKKLAKNIPEDYLIVCESGIHTNRDISSMKEANMYCFLVGESLMRKEDVAQATRALLE